MRKHTRIYKAEDPLIEVCPYQYTRCEKPADEVCKVNQVLCKIEDLHQWKRKVDQAIKCQYRGDRLTLGQHEHRRLGVVVSADMWQE